MLSEEQQQELKRKILTKLSRIEDDIVYLEEATKPISPENAIGRISRMDAINNKSVAENTLRTSKDTLGKLKEALDNIGSETFGKCQKCQGEIKFQRLLFMPESRRCTTCARQSV